jgi:hypothetical protein
MPLPATVAPPTSVALTIEVKVDPPDVTTAVETATTEAPAGTEPPPAAVAAPAAPAAGEVAWPWEEEGGSLAWLGTMDAEVVGGAGDGDPTWEPAGEPAGDPAGDVAGDPAGEPAEDAGVGDPGGTPAAVAAGCDPAEDTGGWP